MFKLFFGNYIYINNYKINIYIYNKWAHIFQIILARDLRDCHIEFTGDTLKMPISDDLMGAAEGG